MIAIKSYSELGSQLTTWVATVIHNTFSWLLFISGRCAPLNTIAVRNCLLPLQQCLSTSTSHHFGIHGPHFKVLSSTFHVIMLTFAPRRVLGKVSPQRKLAKCSSSDRLAIPREKPLASERLQCKNVTMTKLSDE